MHNDCDNMIVFNTFNRYGHTTCIALDKTYWIAFFNFYSLGRWLLLWKAGYASSIGRSNFASLSAETSAGPYIMSYKAHRDFDHA